MTELATALSRATATTVEQGVLSVRADGQPLAEFSPHGSLTFFVPPRSPAGAPRRLATFDRRGRLLLLLRWAPDGTLVRFKVRGLDGRFLGVLRGTASHLGWGLSDSVCLLEGEEGFSLDRSLTLFRSVAYEDLDCLPPLDDPTRLPAGAGSTVLNVLALQAGIRGRPLSATVAPTRASGSSPPCASRSAIVESLARRANVSHAVLRKRPCS
ncbi:MAG: hypothetical protein E6J80_04460 [Deltaproteobacteria bacterium]|nr:MAG: hypothetical protein E6J80_04460 [Deltaproteobacteria bacterium]